MDSEIENYIKSEPNKYLDSLGCSLVNFYIKLEANNIFCIFLHSGMEFTPLKKEKLLAHSVPHIFTNKTEVENLLNVNNFSGSNAGEIKSTQTKVVCPNLAGSITTGQIEETAFKLVSEIIPSSIASVDLLKQASICIDKKQDVKAISNIAFFIASANGFSTKQIQIDLVIAIMLMDISLNTIEESYLNQYYTRSEIKDEEMKRKFRNHPFDSLNIVKKQLSFSDSINNLILQHHEYKDGSGFPQGLKGSSISPISQILGLAVNIFEEQRFRTITNGSKIVLAQIILEFHKNLNEGSGKFNTKLFEGIIKYFKQKIRSQAA